MIQLPFQCPCCISWQTEQTSERHFCEVSIFFLNIEHNKNILTMAIKTSQDCDSLTQGRNLEQRLISYVGLLCQWRHSLKIPAMFLRELLLKSRIIIKFHFVQCIWVLAALQPIYLSTEAARWGRAFPHQPASASPAWRARLSGRRQG